MNDFLKWSGKHLLIAVLWVFILSITIKGKTLFSHAHGVLVENKLVETIDYEMARTWDKVIRSVRLAFSEGPEKSAQSL